MLELPLYAYSRARSIHFTLQYILFNSIPLLLPGDKGYRPKRDLGMLKLIQAEVAAVLKADAENIARGVYPAEVLRPEAPLRDLFKLPALLADSYDVYRRRLRGRTTEFDARAKELLEGLPRYYRRNFHFQSGGYLSEKSASFYDYQVELLFLGAADAMRRLILPPLKNEFGKTGGKGLKFLEIGAGTGRATRSVHLAFPKAKITALDLSEPYLKTARRNLDPLDHIDWIQGDGARLPFKDGEFDAVYSVFLFHELPREERKRVLAESRRVLKKGGFLGMVDSLQLGDKPELDFFLRDFPKLFHEPFYNDYIAHPMEELVRAAGFSRRKTDHGFFSKAVCALRR